MYYDYYYYYKNDSGTHYLPAVWALSPLQEMTINAPIVQVNYTSSDMCFHFKPLIVFIQNTVNPPIVQSVPLNLFPLINLPI